MSTDKGFTAGFGGTFGVIAALVVIFLVLPCLGMVGCVGCAIITAGSARDTLRESARQAREAQEVQHEDPPADEDLPDSLELDPLEHQQHHQQDHEEGLIDDETPNSAEVQMPDRGPRHLADLIEESEAAVVRIETGTSTSRHLGSGFVVDTTGIVVTNYHVLEGARSIEVTFRDGSEAEVSGVLWADPKKDIAIIQLKEMPPGATTLPLTSEVPRRGTSVFAIGAPRGLGFTASEGIVSAIRESDEINVLFGAKVEGTWIQTTAPISSGNSGGPLIDEDGVVVGINTMTLVEGQNLNFAMFSGDVAEALGEARDAEPQPIASFDSGSRVAIQSRETIGLTIPAKRDFIHDYEIVDRYDEVDQRRTITVRGGDQYGVGLEVADGLYLRVIIPMPDDGPPSMAMFIFASSSRNWQYLRYRALRIVCDGQRLG